MAALVSSNLGSYYPQKPGEDFTSFSLPPYVAPIGSRALFCLRFSEASPKLKQQAIPVDQFMGRTYLVLNWR